MSNLVEAGSDMVKIIVVGKNLSGMDAGEIDYSIAGARFDNLKPKEQKQLRGMLADCLDYVNKNMKKEESYE